MRILLSATAFFFSTATLLSGQSETRRYLYVSTPDAAALFVNKTIRRFMVLEDDGEFMMATYFLGVAHPPGYPLYVLLAHPFTWLPFGEVALRVHLEIKQFR